MSKEEERKAKILELAKDYDLDDIEFEDMSLDDITECGEMALANDHVYLLDQFKKFSKKIKKLKAKIKKLEKENFNLKEEEYPRA